MNEKLNVQHSSKVSSVIEISFVTSESSPITTAS